MELSFNLSLRPIFSSNHTAYLQAVITYTLAAQFGRIALFSVINTYVSPRSEPAVYQNVDLANFFFIGIDKCDKLVLQNITH